jgi:IS6 family transposase
MTTAYHSGPTIPPQSAFVGFRFPPDVIVLAVRGYLRFGLSYRDVEELLAERGVEVDHVTVYRWVLRFTLRLAEAERRCRHQIGGALDGGRDLPQGGRAMALRLSCNRPVRAGHRRVRLAAARYAGGAPVLRARHRHDQAHAGRGRYRASSGIPGHAGGAAARSLASHRSVCQQPHRGRPRSPQGATGPMRGLKQDRSAKVVVAGHAFVQNVRRGHYELAVEEPVNRRVAVAFKQACLAI